MRRALVMAAAALLIAAPAASAKEISRVKVCGVDSCVTTRDDAVLSGLTNGGPPTVPPPMRGGVISLRGTITHEGETIAHTTSWWAPALHLLVAEDGTWMPLPARSAAALDRLAGGLEPFPPETIGMSARQAPTPPHRALESGDGTDWLAIALGGAIVAAIAALILWRRPPHRRAPATGL